MHMSVVEKIQLMITAEMCENPDKLKKQVELIAQLPGQYNEQVLEKLYELAQHDPKAIDIFVKHFLKTALSMIQKEQ